jgi:hypothetical protein
MFRWAAGRQLHAGNLERQDVEPPPPESLTPTGNLQACATGVHLVPVDRSGRGFVDGEDVEPKELEPTAAVRLPEAPGVRVNCLSKQACHCAPTCTEHSAESIPDPTVVARIQLGRPAERQFGNMPQGIKAAPRSAGHWTDGAVFFFCGCGDEAIQAQAQKTANTQNVHLARTGQRARTGCKRRDAERSSDYRHAHPRRAGSRIDRRAFIRNAGE